VVLLIVASFLFAIIAYKMAIKKTVVLYNECKTYDNYMAEAQNAPKDIALLEKQLKKVDAILQNNDTSNIKLQYKLLDKASAYCLNNPVILSSYIEPEFYQYQDYDIETNKIVLEGGFHNLLKFIYKLEVEEPIGKVVSVKFEKKKQLRTENNKLFVSIYVQGINKIEFLKR